MRIMRCSALAFYDSDHLVPFQCMISVRGWPVGVVLNPTAQALAAEVAVTATSWRRLSGLGLATRDQAVPFQRKIRSPWPVGAEPTPTAQALAGEMALTPNRGPTVEPGPGVATRDQAVPFQCKISASHVAEELPHAEVQYCPTAQALAEEVALTPRSSELAPGLGLATWDQVVPFQCTICVFSRAGDV